MVLNMQNLVGLLCQVENYLLSFYDSSKSQIGHSNLCFWLTSLSLCCDTGCMVEYNNYFNFFPNKKLNNIFTTLFKLWWVALWFTLFYFDVLNREIFLSIEQFIKKVEQVWPSHSTSEFGIRHLTHATYYQKRNAICQELCSTKLKWLASLGISNKNI